jgi:5-methylcytosine-specific restriction protein A
VLYDARWKRESADFIAGKRCIDCGKAAELTDHSTAHQGNAQLFWRRELWVPRCWSCHSKKTVREDGGFGRSAERQQSGGNDGVSWG